MFLLCVGFQLGWSQTFNFNTYDSSIGLPQNYIYSVQQDYNGFIWIATAEGVSRYDGVKFVNFSDRDSLAENFTRTIFVDRERKRIVFGHNNGYLSVFDNNGFRKIVIADASSPIRGICAAKDGAFWAVEQNNGLIRIGSDNEITAFFDRKKFGRLIYTSIQPLSSGQFLVGTTDGLHIAELSASGEPESIVPVDGMPLSSISCIVKRPFADDEYWIGTEDAGFFRYDAASHKVASYEEDASCINHHINKSNIQSIQEDRDGSLLLGTWGQGVVKLHYDPSSDIFDYSQAFNQENGLANNYIKDILLDRENNFWFATYGGGIVSLVNECFSFYNFEEIGLKNNRALSVLRVKNDLWIGLENGLMRTDPTCFSDHEYYDEALGLPSGSVTGLCHSNNGILWVATSNHGLYRKSDNQLRFSPVRYTERLLGMKINAITSDDLNIYLATQDGFYVVNKETGRSKVYSTENGLPHNCINFVFIDPLKQIWLGTKDSGITLFKESSFEVHRLAQSPINVSGMTVDAQQRIWLSTFNRGILCYTADTLINYTVQEGLEKNYCYDIACDSHNRIWVAHQPGVSCYNISRDNIRRFGLNSQLNAGFNKFYKDEVGDLWFASSQGVVRYAPELDVENLYPPMLNFTNISISGVSYPANQSIVLPYPYHERPYLFTFGFVGISLKDPSQVSYEYCLLREGSSDEEEWISLKSAGVKEFDFLPDGAYIFKVRAYNGDGVQSVEPLEFRFTINSPFWKHGWFFGVIALLVVLLVVFIVKYRERNLRQQKQLLEKEVANQTVELRNQKAVIEQKNRDITDSINYAQRIQNSILPPLANLQSVFKESFIFFRPRDIVSGDFYWFNRNANSVVICCADCTGHGVPGAFMSMIGTTILNDIFKLPEVDSPAALLERLDKELKIMLHRNNDIETNDGMDISVVEINLSTYRIRIASAKRPVYLFLDGQFVEYKGNRRSIGDKSTDQYTTPFNNIVYSGQRGDLIYLYSDGYPDQFGGDNGKKLMTTGVKSILNTIFQLPMNEQKETITRQFLEWKGKMDQIDDVIFMGVKLP